jgi:hypothetical protein
VRVRGCLELRPLLLEGPSAVAADELLAGVLEEIEVESDEVLNCLKRRVGFGVRVVRPKGAVLRDGIDGLLEVDRTSCKFW